METIPYFARSSFNAALPTGNLHPGLVFYRFMKIGSGESKFLPSLKDVMTKTTVPFCNTLLTRLKNQHTALENTGVWKIKKFKATLTARLAIGLGISSQCENGITLDQTHGIPLIPGTALKGVAQDWTLFSGQLAVGHPGFVALFGKGSSDEGQKGSVIFFDAIPILDSRIPPFDIDIMNPHFSEYYSDPANVPPADYLKPNPIFFLTVKEGTEFYFSLAARDVVIRDPDDFDYMLCKQSADDMAYSAAEILRNTLSELGVGAKTRTGYGRFKCGEIS